MVLRLALKKYLLKNHHPQKITKITLTNLLKNATRMKKILLISLRNFNWPLSEVKGENVSKTFIIFLAALKVICLIAC